MKNPIVLLFLIIFSIIVSPNLAFSMQKNKLYKTKNIDLKLREKKNYISYNGHISTYDWCKKISKEFLKEKKLALLNGLGLSKEYFDSVKEALLEKEEQETEKNKQNILTKQDSNNQNTKSQNSGSQDSNPKDLTILKPKDSKELHEISKSIKNVLNNPIAKQKIEKLTKNNHQKIEFFSEPKNSNNLAITRNNKIFISEELYKKYIKAHNNLLLNEKEEEKIKEKKEGENNCKLEPHIGHELMHILRKHTMEKNLFETFYELQIKQQKNTVPKFELDLLLDAFIIATEIDADIQGILGNIKWAKSQHNFYSDIAKETEFSNYEIYSNNKHPKFTERANYFKEIYLSMENELVKSI